jgi:hypothetical protein
VLLLRQRLRDALPRFDQAVTTSFARQPMRKLETGAGRALLPESKRDEALRLIQRLDRVRGAAATQPLLVDRAPKVLAYLTTANFDNAYVQPQVGGLRCRWCSPTTSRPSSSTSWRSAANHVDDVSCHEATHYVQFQEVDELWYYLNLAFGDLLDPNIFTESYFLEGLATYYEGRSSGTPGVHTAHLARAVRVRGGARGRGRSGRRSLLAQRELLPFGGNYLVGCTSSSGSPAATARTSSGP